MSENSDSPYEGSRGRTKAMLSDDNWPNSEAPANNSALSRELFANMPLNAKSPALQFWDVYDKFNYDDTDGLTKEEVQRAAADPSLKPSERKMAQLLNENFDTIKPLGWRDVLMNQHLINLDSITKDGVNNAIASVYVVSTAKPYSWAGTLTMLGGHVGPKLMPNGLGKILGKGGSWIGAGLVFYGIGKGVYDYYDAKPKLEGISREVRKIPIE